MNGTGTRNPYPARSPRTQDETGMSGHTDESSNMLVYTLSSLLPDISADTKLDIIVVGQFLAPLCWYIEFWIRAQKVEYETIGEYVIHTPVSSV